MISIFESIKRRNEQQEEYWSARELYKVLGYTEYGKFLPTIKRAIISCKTSQESSVYHFAEVSEMIKIAVGTTRETFREVENYHLTRYECYLIAQNGDPKKTEIAEAQKYFAF